MLTDSSVDIKSMISEALSCSETSISYKLRQKLASMFPDHFMMETQQCTFEVENYIASGKCTSATKPGIHHQIFATWGGENSPVYYSPRQTWRVINWNGIELEIVQLRWTQGGYGETTHYWIIAQTREIAEQFFNEVCTWATALRDEVFVFEQGYWQKSRALYRSIQSASLDSVVLAGNLKQTLLEDFSRFFASRDTYDRYGVPWKRGALLIGPPGNGKTQTIKGLINALKVPCLYVKSVSGDRAEGHVNVRYVFDYARSIAPCILVLEDLDSMVNANNRSFFLNEMDGLAANTGIVVLATTNHPEDLDPAILDRPSRFDRKYHFNLPEQAEREAYLQMWNAELSAELKLSEAGIAAAAEATQSFSFAYLKELMLSSVMAWMNEEERASMDSVVLAQVSLLRSQMAYMIEERPDTGVDD